nr:hypothetical protein [Tanacetum cinerariifolium]
MDMTIDQQVTLDEALFPHASRLRIGKSNFLLRSDITSKESTIQLVYDVLRLTPFYKAFLVTTDVPEIYMEMMHICPRLPGPTFDDLPFEEEIIAFHRFLGQSGEIRKLTNGMYHKKNVDFAYLLWEDFVYQVEYKDAKMSNEMYYPRFTKVIIHYFMTKDPSISRRNKLTNEDIRNSEAYKEYYAVASGAVPPKTKASVRKTKSSSDTTITPPTDVGTRLSTFAKGKQPAKPSKAKSLTVLSEMYVLVPTTVASLTLSAPNLTPPTIPTISIVPQAPTAPKTAPSTLLIVQRYMDQRMNEAVKNLDENIQKIIKEQVKEQVKVHVSKILPKIKKDVNEQLEYEVLTCSSNSSKTSYVVVADLSEMEIKKILIEKMESNKRRDVDADKDEEPSTGSNRGSKRRREGKERESTSAPKEKATRTTGKSTQGSKSQQKTASESAPAEELIRKYTTSVTKTKAADYGHIKWIEDLVPRTMWSQEPRLSKNVYKKHRHPKACGRPLTRHNGEIRRLTDVNINKLHQQWRSFTAIINKCLSGKSTGYDSIRLSQAQILWGLYHKKNVDFAYLLWEEFVYQVEHKDANKSNEMYYLRDDQMFTTIKLVSRHQSAMLPIELTNEDIRNSEAYNEYYAVATGAAPPKTKASVRKIKSSSDTTVTPPTDAAGIRLSTSTKGKQPAKASKAKSLTVLSGVAMTETEQLKLATKRSLQQTHISQASGLGADEGTDYDDVDEGSDNQDDDDAQDNDDDNQDDDDQDEGDDDDDQDEGNDDDQDSNKECEEFIHPKEEGQDEEDDEDELYRDVNINLEGRVVQMADVHTTQEFKDTHVTLTPDPTTVAPLTLFAPTLTPSTIATISTVPQVPTPPTTALSTLLLRDEAQAENEKFLNNLEENIQKIVKEQVKEQVKVQVSKILWKIKKTVNEQLEAEVLTRSSNSSKTSYAVAADLSEMELKKILIEKMEGKKRRDDDAEKDEEPSVGSDRGSKRRREGKEPESTSAPKEKATRTTGESTRGSKYQQRTASESAPAEEPLQTTHDLEELSHQEFKTGAADNQPIAEASQHPEWFSEQKKPSTLDRDWNKTLPATHESIQPWISDLAKQTDSRSSFNELMDTHVDFSAFLMNRLKVDTLTPELLARPTYELMKGSCKSASSRKYITSVTKKKAADYGHIKWIEDLVPRTMWIQEPVSYDKHALWGISHWGRKRQQFYGFAVNRESARDVYSKRRIITVTELKIVEWYNYKHLDWITLHRDDDKLYKFKEGDFKRLCIQDIEDMLLLLVQGKLTNLTVEECFAFNVSLRMFTRSIVIQRRVEDLQLDVESYQKKLNLTRPDMYRSDLKRKEAYTAYSNPRGFIYQNKDKQNRLMRIDELHKFNDGTLNDVCTALDDRLKSIRMKYLPQTIWRKSDKERAAAMIQAIDKQLKTRRIMRSLEKFVGGRLQDASTDHMIYHMMSFSFNGQTRTYLSCEFPESEGSTQGYPLVSVEVLRYDKRSKSENMGIVPTKMELILEYTQQGISHKVLVSAEGVEE